MGTFDDIKFMIHTEDQEPDYSNLASSKSFLIERQFLNLSSASFSGIWSVVPRVYLAIGSISLGQEADCNTRHREIHFLVPDLPSGIKWPDMQRQVEKA